jgi:hypothetical protein
MELERPRHTSQSYTNFDLSVAGDARYVNTSDSYTNFDLSVAGDARYVNASKGFRESCPDRKC